jgi:hypothetical protein
LYFKLLQSPFHTHREVGNTAISGACADSADEWNSNVVREEEGGGKEEGNEHV